MKQVDTINGREFREMLSTATSWLEKSSSDVDALNVFPVPDGDTGTNMLLTMRSGVDEAFMHNNSSVSDAAKAVAQGALMGARGNSGVILSQIWRGMAEGVVDKKTINGEDVAIALQKAADVAYKGISNPVEGTILTVVREAAQAGQKCVDEGKTDPISVMEAIVEGAGESVANTPTLLPVLKDAGVVDAGGQGLYTILEGALRYLRGEAEQMQFRKPQMIASSIPMPVRMPQISQVDEVPFGYCTEFMLKGEGFNPDKIRDRLKKEGESLIVVGDENTTRVHVHTLDPGKIIKYATSLGTLHQVSIRNMDEQYHDFLEVQKSRAVEVDTATIAVVSGDGLAEVFASLGTTAIVPGGQTMNPSTKDILQAVNAIASDKVIILPNNKNIILTAEQVKTLSNKSIEVIPTQTIPQGVAALLAFDYEADFSTNADLMKEATSMVKTIEITRAVRAAQLDGLSIKKKQAIGLLDGELLAAGKNTIDILDKMLAKLDMNQNEIVTVYYGADASSDEASQVSESIREQYPQLQVEVVKGGQPYYDYIVSIE
ncbi:MAG: DAK2 domain-containing protein [Dehalococcoidales bacterium]|nr:DAK2 domain-containing protein [Dehalococcoidales bacterium]